jgi:hypothetical protein
MKATTALAMLAAVTVAGADMLYNGGFDVGLQGWSCYARGSGGYPNDVRLASSDPRPEWRDGMLLYAAPEHSNFVISSRAQRVTPGTYELRASVKTETGCTIELIDSGKARENALARVDVRPGDSWTQVRTEATVEAEQLAVAVRGEGPGVLQLDDVEVDGKADRQWTAEVGLAAPRRVLMLGEEPNLEARILAKAALEAKLTYRIEDAWGEAVAEGNEALELPAGDLVRIALAPKIERTGHYRVLAQVTADGQAVSQPAEMLLAVIPRRELAASTIDADESRFGCNMVNRPALMDVAQAIGMRWVFCAPPLLTKWFSVEPRPGEWITYDDVVTQFEQRGLRLVGNLADPPYWATRSGDERYSGPWPNATVPTDWSQWESYVTRTVEHYNPRITHWGVWNEPNHPGYLKLAEGEEWAPKYVELLRHTHPQVKAVDPAIQVIGGTVTNPGALPPLVAAGGLEFMDVAAFHWSSWSPDGYVRATGEELGLLGPKETWVNCIERITDAYDTAGRSVPLWDTECHLTEADVAREFLTQPAPPRQYKTPAMTALDAAAAVPRQHIAEWAAGVDRTFAWLLAGSQGPWQPRNAVTLLEWDRSPAAALVTYAVMTDMLDDAQFVGWEATTDTAQLDRPTFWTFTFGKPGGGLRVVWGNREAERELVLDTTGTKVTVRDMFGVARQGTDSMSGVALANKIVLWVGRYPYYVFEST